MRSNGISLRCFLICLAVQALAGCSQPASTPPAPILLFTGTGASPNDVTAFKNLLSRSGYSFETADSARLNAMTQEQLAAHRLILIPGGNYLEMGRGLTPEATGRVRNAIKDGVNYLGICAGGLLAGKAKDNSFDLTSGVKFDFYAVVNRGIHKAAVPITIAGKETIEHYWEDGPQFTGWGDIIGSYPDGTPAIVEGAVGKGWVVLCGLHPEAPQSWRKGMNFSTDAAESNRLAFTLIDAALNGRRLKPD